METRLDRLVIIGAGAVGGSIAGLLHESGFPVAVVARGEHGRAIRESGLTIRLAHRSIVANVDCHESVQQVDWKAGDMAMVATKLTDAKAVLKELSQVAGRQIPVVCASNGIHGERWAADLFDHVISMLVWTPAAYLKAGEVSVYSGECPAVLDNGCFVEPKSVLSESAEVMQWSQLLCAKLQSAGFAAEPRTDMQRWKYAKWITNLGNASQALVTDDWRACAKAAQAEGERVLDHAEIDRVTVKELIDRCRVVKSSEIDGQKRQGGSTWQSLQRGRPLESIWLEGAMADMAEKIGVAAPINRFLAEVSMNPRLLTAEEVLRHASTGVASEED